MDLAESKYRNFALSCLAVILITGPAVINKGVNSFDCSSGGATKDPRHASINDMEMNYHADLISVLAYLKSLAISSLSLALRHLLSLLPLLVWLICSSDCFYLQTSTNCHHISSSFPPMAEPHSNNSLQGMLHFRGPATFVQPLSTLHLKSSKPTPCTK